MTDEAPLALVADDNADILRLVAGRLRTRGYEVVTATDGAQALAALTERRPAVAVLDWVMPEMTGLEVCAHAKRAPETAGTAILLLTARAADTDIAAGTDCGADAYLTKPFDITELVDVVRRITGTEAAA